MQRSRNTTRSIAAFLAFLAATILARGAAAALLAESISVCGDSISRAFNAGACTYGDQPARVWATGDDHGGQLCSAGGDGVYSHAERLECAKGGHVAIFNDAASGADVLSDFHGQATRVKLNLSSSLAPRYVTVFLGHNDACTDAIEKTGNGCGGDRDPNNYCRTTEAAFEREFRRGLDQLIQIPGARISVLALARVSELCEFEEMSGCGLTFGLPCGTVWALPVADICRSLTHDCSNQRRIDMYETLVGYNAVLEVVSAEVAAIPVGQPSATGAVKAGGVELRFQLAPFYYKFRPGDISCCDCFHPSLQGQQMLAEAAWNGLACTPSQPCCADTGNLLSDARCTVEDHTSFYPGGFWPGGEACGNGILDPGEECDDGPSGGDGCCSPTCRRNDRDGDGACDPGDPCVGGAAIERSRVVLSGLGAPLGDETLALRGDLTVAHPFQPPLDPLSSGARFLLRGRSGTLVDATLAGGAYDGRRGWERRGRSFVYRSREADPPGGVSNMIVHDASDEAPGRVRVEVRTRERSLAVAPGDLPLQATVVLDPAPPATAQCGELALDATPPGPVCTFSESGRRLDCR